jgi:hypothetical protein
MKTCLYVALLLFAPVACSTAVAGNKHPTGHVIGDQFVDQRYNVTLKKYGNWKFGKIADEDSANPIHTRCLISQKNFILPSEWQDNEEKFNAPTLGLWVDTTDMVLDAYAAELAYTRSKRPSRKELARDFPILQKGDYVGQEPTKLAGERALLLHYRQPYEVQLEQRGTNNFKLIEEVLLGDVYLVKRDNLVFVLHFTSERAIYRTANDEAKDIIMSLDLHPKPDSSQSAPPAGHRGQ